MYSRAFGARAIASLVASATLAATIAATIAVPAHAAPDGSAVVISEVYGGGGNAGAPYTHDFIEFFNPTAQEISLEGYSVAYLAANGNTGGTAPLPAINSPSRVMLLAPTRTITPATSALAPPPRSPAVLETQNPPSPVSLPIRRTPRIPRTPQSLAPSPRSPPSREAARTPRSRIRR